MIDRRTLVAAAVSALAAPPALAAAPEQALAFRVRRKGSDIGEHALTFARSGDSLVVGVAVDLVVRIGVLPLYRYRHEATEIWTGDAVVRLESRTDANGKDYRVLAELDDAGDLLVEGTLSGRYVAPAEALPATHWNRRMLDGPMINTQSGVLMTPAVTRLGAERIVDAGGRRFDAERYALRGDATLDTWYEADERWAALTFAADDGSTVEYVRA